MYDSKEIKGKVKAPTMFIELVDQRDSGWVMDGTERTANPVKITSPSAKFIPNRGFRLVKKKDETGQGYWENEAIRYIKNCPTLSVEEQNRRGFRPSRNKQEDLIIVKKGNFSVTREGSFASLYDYLQDVFYNASNPNRPTSAKAIFKVVELGKKEEGINEKKLAIAEATQFIGTLFARQGKEYRYDEEKIDALCQLFLVYAETPSGKINGLMAHAEKDPVGFLDKALRFEQTIELEIGEALALGVIKFDEGVACYANKEKVIAAVGTKTTKQEKNISKLAALFGTSEYKSAYDEFKIELDTARNKKK